MAIKYTLDVRQYRDKAYGNTYFAARAHDIDGNIVLYLPFQYGYGNRAEHVAAKELNCGLDDLRAFYSEGHSQSAVKSWGHKITGPYRVVYNKRGHTVSTMAEVSALMDTAREYDIKVKDASGVVFIQRVGVRS